MKHIDHFKQLEHNGLPVKKKMMFIFRKFY